MTILEKIKEYFLNCEIGEIFTRNEIIEMIHKEYGINKSSIIPSDYCYNISNKGKEADKNLKNFNLFLWVERGVYKYV